MTTQPLRYNSKLTVAEIFNLVRVAETDKDKIQVLEVYKRSEALKSIIRLQFDSRFKFALPEGTPPNVKPNVTPAGLGEEGLHRAYKKLYVFIEGASNLKQSKRELLFVGLLETLDKDEAELLKTVKDKKLSVGLTKEVIDHVYPGLIPVEHFGGEKSEAEAEVVTPKAPKVKKPRSKSLKAKDSNDEKGQGQKTVGGDSGL